MKKKILVTLSLVLFFVCAISGQIVPPPIPPPPGLPIDGGLLFLLASGLFYGIRKIKK